MPKATWKKDAKKCAKKSFGLEIWCSWLCFRRPGARPGRPKSVPRAAQDGPKIWEQLCQSPLWRSWALLGTFLLFFAILFEFWMIFRRFLFEFWSILRRFLTESASNQSSQSKPKQAEASKSKQKHALEPTRVEVQNEFHTSWCNACPSKQQQPKATTDFELKLQLSSSIQKPAKANESKQKASK